MRKPKFVTRIINEINYLNEIENINTRIGICERSLVALENQLNQLRNEYTQEYQDNRPRVLNELECTKKKIRESKLQRIKLIFCMWK